MGNKVLKSEPRTLVGRKVKNLRKQGILPGNVYGNKIKSHAVQVDLKKFQELYKEVGETGLFDLEIGKDLRPVLIHNIQINAKTEEMLHVDFMQVNLKVKITASVPVEIVGESPAEKQGVGTVVQQLNEIEVEALPADLPERFEVSVDNLSEVDQAVYVKDIKIDTKKVEFKVDQDLIVVKVEPPQKEEVVESPIVAVGAEGAVTTETTESTENTTETKKEE